MRNRAFRNNAAQRPGFNTSMRNLFAQASGINPRTGARLNAGQRRAAGAAAESY